MAVGHGDTTPDGTPETREASALAREIKRAFSERVKQFNPEKHGDDKEKYQKAVRNRKIVTRAYQVLSDPELRARYDRGEPVE